MAVRSAIHQLPGVVCNAHDVRLSEATEDAVITVVRDPVARFQSAFYWVQERVYPGKWPWEAPELMAYGMGTPLVDKAFRLYNVLWPQTYWLDCDRPLAWLGHTESLDADVARLGPLLGASLHLSRSNVGRYQRRPLPPTADTIIRDFYAADYDMLERLADGI